jgi:hypothetical protein
VNQEVLGYQNPFCHESVGCNADEYWNYVKAGCARESISEESFQETLSKGTSKILSAVPYEEKIAMPRDSSTSTWLLNGDGVCKGTRYTLEVEEA